MKMLKKEIATALLVTGFTILPTTASFGIILLTLGLLGIISFALISYKTRKFNRIEWLRQVLSGPIAAFLVHVLTLAVTGGSPFIIAIYLGFTNFMLIVYIFTIPFVKAYSTTE